MEVPISRTVNGQHYCVWVTITTSDGVEVLDYEVFDTYPPCSDEVLELITESIDTSELSEKMIERRNEPPCRSWLERDDLEE